MQNEIVNIIYQPLDMQEELAIVDKHFVDAAVAQGIDSNPAYFASLAISAMKVLQHNGNPNFIYKWAKCLFGENRKPLTPLHRMPFGLL